MLSELRAYEVPPSQYGVFVENILDQFRPLYNRHSRNASDVIKDSKNFYDHIMAEPPPSFPGFESPPPRFKNGVLHMHCDDVKKNIKWKLELT